MDKIGILTLLPQVQVGALPTMLGWLSYAQKPSQMGAAVRRKMSEIEKLVGLSPYYRRGRKQLLSEKSDLHNVSIPLAWKYLRS